MASPSDLKISSPSSVQFCCYPRQQTTLTDWEHLTLIGGNELERVLLWLAKRFLKFKLSSDIIETNLKEALLAIDFYRQITPEQAQKSFYNPDVPFPSIEIFHPHRLSQGEVMDITFPSSFEPMYEPFRKEFHTYEENKIARARWWKHPKGESRGVVVALHGWFMGDQRVNAITLVPGFFFRLGLDVVLYELPYHGRRAPKNSKEILFPSAHVPRTNEGVAQAIYDLRALRRWFAEEYPELPLGVVGMSLGGYLASLWASLDPLAFAIAMVPLVSMESLAWKLVREYTTHNDQDLREAFLGCVTFEHLKDAYHLHSPLSYKPLVAKQKRMIIAGLGDSFIPAEQPQSLWEHWEQPNIHWFNGGHLEQMSQSSAFSEVHNFLLSLNLAHPELLKIQTAK